jgi:hypothetical protein
MLDTFQQENKSLYNIVLNKMGLENTYLHHTILQSIRLRIYTLIDTKSTAFLALHTS